MACLGESLQRLSGLSLARRDLVSVNIQPDIEDAGRVGQPAGREVIDPGLGDGGALIETSYRAIPARIWTGRRLHGLAVIPASAGKTAFPGESLSLARWYDFERNTLSVAHSTCAYVPSGTIGCLLFDRKISR